MLPWVIKSRRMRWAGYATCMEDKIKQNMIFVGNPEGKRPFEKLRHG
jgi:hypothetical protein